MLQKTIRLAFIAMAVVAMATLNSCVTQKTTVAPATYQPQPSQDKPIPMILDSDFGSSTDDLFALMMLHHYIDEGKVDLKGVVVDREGEKNAQLVDVFNTYYGHPDIPIGLERNGVKNPRCFIPYSGIVDLKDAAGAPLFKQTQAGTTFADGYKLYRKLLSQAEDHSVVVVAIGFVTTLAELFQSEADEYSHLNGVDLFGKKVKAVYIQSGRFESGDSLSGYNMRAASRQSAIFYDKLPHNVDIVMSPSNIGDLMDYPPKDVLVDLSYTEVNPIKSVYTYYTCDTGQRMWDTNCLVNAVLGDDEYIMSPRGYVTFVDKGEESLMLFKQDPNGNARYQMPGDTYFANEKLMDIRRHNRVNDHPARYSIESPQPQYIRHDAAVWAQERLNQLVDKYLGSAGNTLDPDDVRMMFRPLGYTGPNALDYQEAEQVVVDAVYDRMLQKAQRNGKTDLVIITGPPASGKSTAIKQLNLKKAGLIYDANLLGDGTLQTVIDKAKRAGMTKITLVPVYNDPLTCYKNSINRGNNTWRYTAVDHLVNSFRDNVGRLAQIRNAYPDIEIIPVDCTQNQGWRRATIDEALKWDYRVSDSELNAVLTHLNGLIDEGALDASVIESATGHLNAIANMSPANAALAQQITQKVDAIMQEYRMR